MMSFGKKKPVTTKVSDYVKTEAMYLIVIIASLAWGVFHSYVMMQHFNSFEVRYDYLLVGAVYLGVAALSGYIYVRVGFVSSLKYYSARRIALEDGVITSSERYSFLSLQVMIVASLVFLSLAVSTGAWAFMRFVILNEPYGGIIGWLKDCILSAVYLIVGTVFGSMMARMFDTRTVAKKLTYIRKKNK